MVLMTRLQLLTLAAGVATFGVGHYLLIDQVPPRRWLLSATIAMLYHVWWAGSIIALHWRRRMRGKRAGEWYRHSQSNFWLGNLTTVTTFWLLMPFADDAITLLIIFFCMGPVAIEVVGTIRSPDKGPPGFGTIWVPFVVPAGLFLYFLARPSFLHLVIALYLVAFSAIMWRLRTFIQRSVDKAYLAMAEVERLGRERERFLASAAHDFGQPLQAARLFVDQALLHRDAAKRDTAVRNAEWAFDTMARLVDNLGHHLRLRSGAIEAGREVVAVGSVLTRVAAQSETAAARAGVELRFVTSSAQLIGDPVFVDRCLTNFVANALIHAKAQRILIGCRRHGARWRLWCIDDGCGIDPADIDRLFTDYAQGSDHGDEVRGGYGLGLSGTRAMMRLMRGDAGLDVRWTRGSAFWLELESAGPQTD